MRNKISADSFSRKPGAPLLDQYRGDVVRCVKCGSCSTVCPPFLQKRDESFSPRGRMALIKALLEGRLTPSRIFQDRLETCTGCLACEAACASAVPVCDIIQAGKEEAVQELGNGFMKTVMAAVLKNEPLMRRTAWLAPLALRYGSVGEKKKMTAGRRELKIIRRSDAAGPQAKKKGTILFFPGCAVNYLHKRIGTAAISVLKRTGFDTVVPEGLKCCGRPLLSLGDREAAQACAEHNTRLFADVDPVAVVTVCSSCALTFKKEYPKLLRPGQKIPALFDIHEFAARELEGVTFQPVQRSMTWHDPCHLNRGQNLAIAARQLLLRIPGINLIEMKNPDACCGFGGTMRVTHPKLSDSIAREKVKNILATKADAVATGCPACRMQISDSLVRAGSDIEVFHTVQLLEEALS